LSVLPVFVGGTGRSGTTILASVLGRHSCLHVFPQEIRFHVDPDGLPALEHALVTNWSPFQVDLALKRFEQLMRHLRRRSLGRYPAFGLARILGRSRYDAAVRSYLEALQAFAFPGVWAGGSRALSKVLAHWLPPGRVAAALLPSFRFSPSLSDARYLELTRTFLEDLLGARVVELGKRGFVEHTPSNAIHAPFLLRVLPEAKVLNIYRDPRDVITSYMGRDWGPSDPMKAGAMVAAIVERWTDTRNTLPSDVALDVRLEALVHDRKASLQRIFGFLGLAPEPGPLDADLSRHNIGRWRREPAAGRVERFVAAHPLLREQVWEA
jgi:hypothetical protein